ncbi:alpha-amylase family glycosyl hydrolase [Simiduia agarivorans]|uniref:Alpha amylase n=1 Tax=Simiduia agarivorans (strain DSM 21679 / JCM 13881 / BCRC 17597 / SA1) TaxID=1117647 RepID=K4KML3_SIMAS|nr:alpha-amylase family glycosyl hydrolase [Simiduia agarivorans]AFU99328.2 alpha amylase [Simiduia agarivorans SA1 = DSM 21679]
MRSGNLSLAAFLAASALLALGCQQKNTDAPVANAAAQAPIEMPAAEKQKAVVYQVFTRLYGNTNTTNKPWGSIEENGVGKFSDFSDTALTDIKSLGVTHLWYTGVPHHAVIRDYSEYGIGQDDPDVVKGRAGSPYAVKDYYSVNPDLADDPAQRLQEFDALIARTHKHGMKVIIDIVPNHVARNYQSLAKPEGVEDFGAADDVSVEYARDNSFYYVVGEDFQVPEAAPGYAPLGGEPHPLADGKFSESPAKWTGNGARSAQPHYNDWYETVKVNYGVKPDGSYDFDRLPDALRGAPWREHAAFWADKDVPASWEKFRDITQYWLARGVDGFRYDMAEMVPVEFWSYLNSAIKQTNPDAFILAEVYNPKEYRNYVQLGLMDYLYDKVELYDTLKWIIQDKASTDDLVPIQAGLADIEHHMLHFLENHDEQRIASPDFAGNAERGKPLMVISATISTSPTMLYFGQDVGEDGSEDGGFGDPTRTSIFDYVGVPAHQRWMNDGAFDGGQSSADEKALRQWYSRLLNLTRTEAAMMGSYREIHTFNREHTKDYGEKQFAFVREGGGQTLIIVSNLADASAQFTLQLPNDLVAAWQLKEGRYALSELLHTGKHELRVSEGKGLVSLQLPASGSVILELPRHE